MILRFPAPPAAPGGTPWQAPDKTFFVSPTFVAGAPFFNTIQAAVNAADGVNITLIVIYPGTYLEVVTVKNNVFLRGTDRRQVFIGDNASASIILAPTSNVTFGIRDVTLKSTHATTTGISVTPGVGATTDIIYLQDVDITLQFGNSAGFIFNNSTVASNSHQLFINNVNFLVNGSSGCLYISKPPNLVTIDGCVFGGSAEGIVVDSISGVFNTVSVRNSIINNSLHMGGGSAVQWFFDKCIFSGVQTITGGFGNDTAFYRQCVFSGHRFDLLSTSTMNFSFYGCSFKASANDAVIVEVEDTDPRFRFYDCQLENGRVHFTVANIKFIFVNTTIRNSTGTNAISTVSTPTVFLGNFTTDKVLQAGVAQAAGSFNVQTSVAI